MKVDEVMRLEVVRVPPGIEVRDGTSFMRWLGIGPLHVGDGGRISGMPPKDGAGTPKLGSASRATTRQE